MLNIKVFGIVQGVGFRPFVSRIADAFKIVGSVANRGSYVEIFAQGSEINLKKFLNALNTQNPPRSTILKVDVNELPDKNFVDFQIIDSIHESGDIFVSPDISICEKCAEELFDPNNRRYLHPFINCTACGARLTIIKNMPYDRERTSMSEFPMCDACAEEYFNPNSRRYDAQPICCNDCGCEVYLLGKNLRGHDAIKFTRKILADGGIVAIKVSAASIWLATRVIFTQFNAYAIQKHVRLSLSPSCLRIFLPSSVNVIFQTLKKFFWTLRRNLSCFCIKKSAQSLKMSRPI